MGRHLSKIGLDGEAAMARTKAAGQKRSRSEAGPDEAVREAGADSRSEVADAEAGAQGFRNVRQKMEADKQKKLVQTQSNKMGKRGESDRGIQTKMPKHLFSKKTSMGTRDWR
jgi:nucleolar GTP-binding protein